MSNEESSCRSASLPEPAPGNESSVGRGIVNCGMFAARAAAAVEGFAFAICVCICWLMLAKSLEPDSLEKRSCEGFVAWPLPSMLFDDDEGR